MGSFNDDEERAMSRQSVSQHNEGYSEENEESLALLCQFVVVSLSYLSRFIYFF